jgi:hypothetical protein
MKIKTMYLLAALTLLQGCWEGYSTGDRVGVPYKLSRKGILCKTWEGSANLGGMREKTNVSDDGKSSSTAMVPNTWDFTIHDSDVDKVKPVIDEAIEKGQTIKFSYDQELLPICDSDSGYFITAAKVIK